MRYERVFALLLTLALTQAACATRAMQRELENVARNWCYTIRASQVLPVYPLSEDVQPGDVHLVQLPIDRQQEAYAKRGFLPFDNLIARLAPTGYTAFYANSFDLGEPAEPLPESLVRGDGTGWARAPAAAFPSYAFSVKRGSGATIAIPVSGVPIGMSLLNTGAADGSITISDVRTYGVDTVSLFGDVERWARKPETREFLANFAPSTTRTFGLFERTRQNYVRVLSRVYVTRKVNVSLHVSGAQGGELDVEVAKKLAGGSVEIVASSSRSISMDETFPKPLVIGYLAFDMAITKDGYLGPPMPTYAVLADDERPQSTSFAWDTSRSRECIGAWLKDEERNGERLQARVETLVTWWAAEGLPEPATATLAIKAEEHRETRQRFMDAQHITCP